jgi:hypothetical protein
MDRPKLEVADVFATMAKPIVKNVALRFRWRSAAF